MGKRHGTLAAILALIVVGFGLIGFGVLFLFFDLIIAAAGCFVAGAAIILVAIFVVARNDP